MWASDAVGQVVEITPDREWTFGAELGCDFSLPLPGGGLHFTLVHAAVWSLRPAEDARVQVRIGSQVLPRGRGSALEQASLPLTVWVRRGDVETALELSTAPPSGVSPLQSAPFAAPVPDSQPVPLLGPPPSHGWAAQDEGSERLLPVGRVLTVGRIGGPVDIPLDGIDVAEHHADVEWNGSLLTVTDRSRGLGVHVDGEVALACQLPRGASFVIGHHVFYVGGGLLTVRPVRSVASTLVVDGLTAHYKVTWWDRLKKRYKDRSWHVSPPLQVLHQVSFALPAGSLLAVLGPSGAGKSSLCRVLLGEMTHVVGGVVTFQGHDLTRRHALWNLISFVPQAEELPLNLPVGRALELVARLRLAVDPSAAPERAQRVEQVLELMDLVGDRDKKIEDLSGGQRRRVSVAMELLSDPVLLILDEPTSGLDEGLDRRMLGILRRLADAGTSVVLITHSTANLEQAHYALALTSNGEPGFFGLPGQLRPSFGAPEWADVMDALRQDHKVPVPAVMAASARPTAVTTSGKPRHRVGTTRTMVARELSRLANRKAWLIWNLLVPVVIAGLAVGAGSKGLRGGTGGPNQSGTVLSVLAICIAFVATQTSFTSIVVDRAIIVREARWGLLPGPVVWSRALVAMAITVWQAVLSCLGFLWLKGAPPTSLVLPPALQLMVSMLALALASCMLGLLLSAAASSLERAVFTLMGVSVIQVVLCGLVIPFEHQDTAFQRVLATASMAAPTRWGTAAVSASMHYGTPAAIGPAGTPGSDRGIGQAAADPLWSHTPVHVLTAWLVLAAMSVLFLVAARWRVARAVRAQV